MSNDKIIRYAGLAEESTYNPATAPGAVIHVDMASSTLDAPSDSQMIYEGGLERGARTHRPGFYSPSGNLVYAFDINSIMFLLKWALGSYAFMSEGGEGTLNLHEAYQIAGNILPSFCARIGKDKFEQVFGGCTINSLQLAIEGEFCMATADIVAAEDSKASIQDLGDLTLPSGYPLAFHEVTMEQSDSDISADVKSLTLNIANNTDAEAGRGIGSRHPRRVIAGDPVITVEKSLFFKGSAELELLWGGSTGPATDGSEEFDVELTFDAGDDGEMKLELPRLIYNSVDTQPSGRDELVQSTNARAFMGDAALENATAIRTPIYARVENDQAEI